MYRHLYLLTQKSEFPCDGIWQIKRVLWIKSKIPFFPFCNESFNSVKEIKSLDLSVRIYVRNFITLLLYKTLTLSFFQKFGENIFST